MIMEREKIQIKHHSRQVTPQDFINFDLIVCMDSKNKNNLNDLGFKTEGKAEVLLLGSFDPNSSDIFITDPYGGTQGEYESCYNRISGSCIGFLTHLLNVSKQYRFKKN